jgi:hypothetical protein
MTKTTTIEEALRYSVLLAQESRLFRNELNQSDAHANVYGRRTTYNLRCVEDRSSSAPRHGRGRGLQQSDAPRC